MHPEERQRFLVIIDEFQSLKVDYQTMLAELRKYGGSFALATQSLAYLDRFERTLRATVLANVEHTFAFAMAMEDARLLSLPAVDPEDFFYLPDYTCYARLSLEGHRLPTFSLRLHEPAQIQEGLQRDLINQGRTRYGRPVGQVDQELLDLEARRRTMRPAQMRRGGKGYEVLWTGGTGEERVQDVLSSQDEEAARRRGSKKGQTPREDRTTMPEHVLYHPDEPGSEGKPALKQTEEDEGNWKEGSQDAAE